MKFVKILVLNFLVCYEILQIFDKFLENLQKNTIIRLFQKFLLVILL